MKSLQGGGPDAQEGCWGIVEAPGKEPLTPAPRSRDHEAVNCCFRLSEAGPGPSHARRAAAPGLPLQLSGQRPRSPWCSHLCCRFAEQAVFILFCVFAILLFSRDPKFIPGWASLFTPG